jgi:hypothetical protein
MKGLTCLSACLILVVTSISSFSQKSFMKFGDISVEELTMTKYDKDTSAGAVVLGDFGVTKFNISQDDGFTYEFFRHIRIKILDKKELDQADFSILLWVGKGGNEEEFGSLKAVTFNYENGEEVKTKIDKSSVFTEMADKNHKRVKFSLQNVKVGSVIDVAYKIDSPYLFNLNDWQFQRTIPTVRSEYHVYMPEYFNYKNWITGYVPVNKYSDSQMERFQYHEDAEIAPGLNGGRTSGGMVEFEARVEHWYYIAENVPAFIPEPYITTIKDYLACVEFELISTKFPWSVLKNYTSTWENINTEMLDDEDFGKQLKRSGQFKNIPGEINSSTLDPQLKMIKAYETIKNKLAWDGRYRVYPTSGIAKAYNDGGGSSADINLNLVALLRELGFSANPVLVSTRSNGMLRPGQVILSQFNHVIASVQLGEKSFLLDATEPYCPYYLLPPDALNDKGLMISESGYKWVDLYSKLASQKLYYGKFEINSDLTMIGNLSNTYDNFASLQNKKNIKSKTNIEEYKKELEQVFDGAEINDLIVENLDSLYKPLKISMSINFGDKITQGADLIYFNPIIFGREDENYFKKDTREYPVDFNFPFRKKYTFSIAIPAGYQVAELPQPVKIVLPNEGGKFSYMIGNMGNNITVTSEILINQTIFSSINYQELKKFYELVVAKMAEQVVLKKVV